MGPVIIAHTAQNARRAVLVVYLQHPAFPFFIHHPIYFGCTDEGKGNAGHNLEPPVPVMDQFNSTAEAIPQVRAVKDFVAQKLTDHHENAVDRGLLTAPAMGRI